MQFDARTIAAINQAGAAFQALNVNVAREAAKQVHSRDWTRVSNAAAEAMRRLS